MFKNKLSQQEQGFTLVEVLAAILIVAVFTAVAMQMMAVAAVFKVRAQEFAEGTTWIQEDLETVKYQAANYQYTSLKADAVSAGRVLQVASADDFAVGDELIVGTDFTKNKIQIKDATTNPPTITLEDALGTNWLTDTPVVAITRCSKTQTTGFADGLRDKITTGVDSSNDEGIKGFVDVGDVGDVDNLKSSKVFTSKKYRLRRTATIPNDSPYNLLQIKYEVASTSSLDAPVAKFYTEVIPNAALQCP